MHFHTLSGSILQARADAGGESIPLWTLFLVFIAVVLSFGLFYARQHRRGEPGRQLEQGRPLRSKAAGPTERFEEQGEALQISLEDQPSEPAATGGGTPGADPSERG